MQRGDGTVVVGDEAAPLSTGMSVRSGEALYRGVHQRAGQQGGHIARRGVEPAQRATPVARQAVPEGGVQVGQQVDDQAGLVGGDRVQRVGELVRLRGQVFQDQRYRPVQPSNAAP